MIIQLFIAILLTLLSLIFGSLPTITTLPTVAGVNIDGYLVAGIGQFYSFAKAVWPLRDVMIGLVALLGYYAVRMVLRVFLGARAH